MLCCYNKITRLCSFNLGGGGTGGLNIINANTNINNGANININNNINSRAPKAPSDGSGDGGSERNGRWGYEPYYHRSDSEDGRSDGYGRWGYQPYYHRSVGPPNAGRHGDDTRNPHPHVTDYYLKSQRILNPTARNGAQEGEAPSDGSGDGRWGYQPYYHRTGGPPKAGHHGDDRNPHGHVTDYYLKSQRILNPHLRPRGGAPEGEAPKSS